MEAMEDININDKRKRIATIYTDSQVTIQSIKNHRNHKSLIEKIRKKAQEMEKKEWTVQITWIKAHAGHYGNEMADNLAKEATKNKEIIYSKLTKSQVVQQVKQHSIEKWQNKWDQTTKGIITKQFFPNIK
jgi:ribonuclease HI